MSKVLDRKDFGPVGFKWLTLQRLKWHGPDGRVRVWESAERTTRRGDVDGVAIIAKVHAVGQPLKVVLESQFRPPQAAHVIELPAGLVDDGESAAEAALRELQEETGYSGTVESVSPVCYSDPGMTNANMRFVVVDVDADAPENRSVSPQLEDGEFIEVFLLPMEGLYTALLSLQEEKGWDVDARLLMYAAGLDHAAALGLQSPAPPDAATQQAAATPFADQATSTSSVAGHKDSAAAVEEDHFEYQQGTSIDGEEASRRRATVRARGRELSRSTSSRIWQRVESASAAEWSIAGVGLFSGLVVMSVLSGLGIAAGYRALRR